MTLIVVVVFLGAFVVLALLLGATGSSADKQAKQTVAVLEAALASDQQRAAEQIDIRKSEVMSAVPWMNKWLMRFEIAPKLRSLIYQSGLKWTVGSLLLMSAVCAVVAGYLVYWRTGVVALAALIGLAAGFAPLMFVLQKRSMRFGKFEQGMPEAVDLMVSALRSGHSLASALGLVGHESPDPIGSEFRICFEEQNYGLELRVALDHLTSRVPLQDLKIIVAAILIQKESGGNLAEVLDKTAQVIRERFRLKREIQTYTAQGRLTGWILTILPLVLGCALYFISPDNMSLLWKRELGIKLLYAAGAMIILGGLVIRQIVNIDV
jgi:tight adherence protein B